MVLAMLSGCVAFDDAPDEYVEALKPDLYFVIPMPVPATVASVFFYTARPSATAMPVNMRLLAWSNEGGNIYDGSLGDTTLDSPVESGKLLRWSGAVLPPEYGEFDKLGL